LRTGYLLHPNVMRIVIAANLDLIDDDMRDDPEAQRIFLDLMLKHGNPERALRRMNELGVLGAFIPEFEPIVAMMQFNVYHHYTVDEHIIQTISTLAQIERGELVEDLPLSSEILKAGVNRGCCMSRCCLHDIGKGRPEDHSILGAQIARRVCAPAGADRRGMRNGRMAGALSPPDVRHGAEARYWRPAHGARFCQGGENPQAAGSADGADGLRHSRRGAEHLEQLEGACCCASLHRQTSEALEGGLETSTAKTARMRPSGAARPAARLGRQAICAGTPPLRPLLAGPDHRHPGRCSPGCLRDLADTRSASTCTLIPPAMPPAPVLRWPTIRAFLAPGRGFGAGRGQCGGRPDLYVKRRLCDAGVLGAGRRGPPYEVSRLPRLRQMIDKTLKGEVVPARRWPTATR
jgi:hypothetical protein